MNILLPHFGSAVYPSMALAVDAVDELPAAPLPGQIAWLRGKGLFKADGQTGEWKPFGEAISLPATEEQAAEQNAAVLDLLERHERDIARTDEPVIVEP